MGDEGIRTNIPPVDEATAAFIDSLSAEEYNGVYDRILTKLVTQNEILAGVDPSDPFLDTLASRLTDNWFGQVQELSTADRDLMALITLTQLGEAELAEKAKNSLKPPQFESTDTPAARARRELLSPIRSAIFAGEGSTIGYLNGANELVEIRFDFDKAYEYWLNTLGASPAVRENAELQRNDVKRKWIDDATRAGGQHEGALPLDYLFSAAQPSMDFTSGEIGIVEEIPKIREQVRDAVAAQMGEDFPRSETPLELLERVRGILLKSMAKNM